MDYAQMADRLITQASELTARAGDETSTVQLATIDAMTGIGYALLHLAETVARLGQ